MTRPLLPVHPDPIPADDSRPTRSAALDVRLLSVVFAVSGVCGLIYESIWSHYLKLFVGHAAYAQTVVLIVFIGGMALGAAVVGRCIRRIRAPLLGYAIAEGLVGVCSLLFHRVFVASTDWAYATLLPSACVPESACMAQWMFAAVLILPQSILLGTTFPLMTSAVLRLSPIEPGRRIAWLYFLNSIGAAAGVLVAGFVLIPALGLPGTLLTAGLANIVVAVAAWWIARRAHGATTSVREPPRAAIPSATPRRTMMIVAALTGLSSFIYEVIWVRMLSLVVGASTHAFELMLAAFIIGLALGGLWVRNRIDGRRDLVFTLGVVQVLMGIAAVATLALYDGMFDFMSWMLSVLRRVEPAYVLYNVVNHAIALAIMLPATFFAGMTFPLITTALFRGRDGERAIGYTYAANTFGSIVGVVLAVHFALPVLGIKGGLLVGAAIDIALGVALFGLASTRRGVRLPVGLAATGICALLIVLLAVPVLPERLASGVYRNGMARLEADSEVIFHRDGKTASVTVVRSPTTTTITTNGKPDAGVARDAARATSDEVTMVMAGLVPFSRHPQARTAAVIGFGSGMTSATLLGSPNIERVDTIEIEPTMVEGARHFGEVVEAAYVDPRSHIIIDDAKSYFARSNRRYDLIISEPSNPWVSGVSSLFTQEFYARAKRQLNHGGLFVQWIQVYEFNDRLLATILRALDAEFDDYAVYAANDGDLILVASAEALPAETRGDFARWDGLKPLLERVRVRSADEIELRRLAGRRTIRALLPVLGEGVNSDYYPLVDHAAPLARFVGSAATGLMRTATAPVSIPELLGDFGRVDLAIAEDVIFPPLLRSMASSAKQAASYLRTGVFAGQPLAPALRDIGMLRAHLWDCRPLPAGVRPYELMLPVAEIVNPAAGREESTALWELVSSTPCAARMQSRDREWLDLFAAVAARDSSRMALLGTRLAGTSEQGPGLLYATIAGAAGLVASGRLAEADQFIVAMSHRLPVHSRNDPPLRVLAAMARSGLERQASLTR